MATNKPLPIDEVSEDDAVRNSQAMLRRTGRHFLLLTFVTTLPSGEQHRETRSAFVADVLGNWLLITAGHIIKKLRHDYPAAGLSAGGFVLHDRFAGSSFHPAQGVPFHFEPNRCLAVDEPWGDYAAIVLDEMTVRQLRVGGIEPIHEDMWGPDPAAGYDRLLLLGVPTEAVAHFSTRMEVAYALIPIELCDAPVMVTPLHPDIATARIIPTPDGREQIQDIDGMSGGPIFGVKVINGSPAYFITGVQSGWLRDLRIVTFSAATPFLERIKEFALSQSSTGA
jgi:hypothetical protein